ncbi:DUF389 domain-containing protein [Bacteroidota bacterium]
MIKQIFHRIGNFLELETAQINQNELRKEIETGVRFRGANLWILIFAIGIASLGLHTNSTAVIIGAMLISPLMVPINGMGFALATWDLELLRISFRNYLFAVGVSLLTSTLFFGLIPESFQQSEILARTTPGIYDVLIALTGGFAGIIALSHKSLGNVIPGVAIATALMPPLCTAGFGLAHAEPKYFLGAFYLFTINSVFIALATVFAGRIVKLQPASSLDEKTRKRLLQLIWVVSISVFLPSIFLGFHFYQSEKNQQKLEQFVKHYKSYKNNFILEGNLNQHAKKIELVLAGEQLSVDDSLELINGLRQIGLEENQLHIQYGWKSKSSSNQVENLSQLLEEKSQKINALETELKNLQWNDFTNLGEELKQLQPAIQQVYFANESPHSDTITIPKMLVIETKFKLKEPEKERISNWIKIRLKQKETSCVFILTKN